LLDAETQARPTRRVRKAAVALVVFALLGAGAVTAWALRGKTSAPFPDQTTRSYASDELPTLLVDPGSVSDIMGIRLGPSADTFTGFLSNSISRPGCAALVFPLQESTYRETGAIAGYAHLLKPADPADRAADVIQAVAAFETPDLAEKFVERQTASWPACAYETVTDRSRRPSQDWRTGQSQRRDGVLITEVINLDDRRSCQRAATAAANLVVDVRACVGTQIGDQAVILARAIAGKVMQ
jgi:serine/threonine-protein kinase